MQSNTPDISVREAKEPDLEVMIEFNRAIAAETEGKTLDTATVSEGMRLGLADPGKCRYFVAEVGGRVVGQTMVTLEWSDWRCAWFWWLQSVYVQPEHRGRGVFAALYHHILDACRARPDTCGLRLYVERNNRRAIDAYLRLGMHSAEYEMMEYTWG
ncbi:MAG: GNAT family N-acetyltransferase [bacterium]|nr:GNAT family N-acetyltransferase [bacterium]